MFVSVAGSRRLLSSLALVLVAGSALTACGGDTPATKSNADLLKDAVANMKTVKTYHMNVDVTTGGQHVTMDGDIDVSANNLKLSMNAAGTTLDIVTVNGDNYVSGDGGKTYTKTDASAVPDMSAFTTMWSAINSADIDKAKDSLKDANPATEQIDGTATKHITGDAAALGTGATGTDSGTLDVWVTTDAKPTVRQMKFAGTDGSGGDTNGTFKWSNIDGPVTITAPPVTLRPGIEAGLGR